MRQLNFGNIDMDVLMKDYRKAVKSKEKQFTSDCVKGEKPLEFVTKFCYYWIQNIEMRTGLKFLTRKDHEKWYSSDEI